MVSWDDIQVFLTRLNAAAGGAIPEGWAYVLPTEAQWEYACRAGTTTAYSWGDTITTDNANYQSNGYYQTRDVGSYDANPWGFFDMHGNVLERTSDWYAPYSSGALTDPKGPATGSNRVLRGGSWLNGGSYLRSAFRYNGAPSYRYQNIGFRLAFRTNKAPVDLNSSATLTIAENQSIGTIVGEFNATDPDGDAITYSLVSGEGDGNNSLFKILDHAEFDPTTLSSLKLWLDANDSSSITQSSGAVSQWADKSVGQYQLSQATSTKQPVVGTNAINGLDTLVFDGTDDYLTMNFRMGMSANPDILVLTVLEVSNLGTSDDRIFHLGGGSNSLACAAGTAGWSWRYDGGNEVYGSVSTSSAQILGWEHAEGGNFASSKFYINGVEQARTAGSNDTTSPSSTNETTLIGSNFSAMEKSEKLLC